MKLQTIKSALLYLLLLSVSFSFSSIGADDVYMKINGQTQGDIEGDVNLGDEREFSFKISEMHHLIRNPGRTEHQPLIVTTHMSKSLPSLLKALDTREPLTTTIKFYRQNFMTGADENYYSIVLSQALLIAVEPIMLDNTVAENLPKDVRFRLRFSYVSITHTYKPDTDNESVTLSTTP